MTTETTTNQTVHVTSNSTPRDGAVKLAGLYDFWSYAHNNLFPKAIIFGNINSYGNSTRELVLDIIHRDIDSRYMVIPKGFTSDNVFFDTNELSFDEAAKLADYIDTYLRFRTAIRQK